jgi:hypothetical protein
MDFFISYNKADRDWAEWIAWVLEEAGYSVVIQAWDIRPGKNFVIEMQRAICDAARTIPVLSLNYIDAEFTQPEWAATFVQDPTGKNAKLVPVIVRKCDPPGLLKSIIHINLSNLLKRDDARRELLDGIRRGRVKPLHEPDFSPTTTRRPPEIFPGIIDGIRGIQESGKDMYNELEHSEGVYSKAIDMLFSVGTAQQLRSNYEGIVRKSMIARNTLKEIVGFVVKDIADIKQFRLVLTKIIPDSYAMSESLQKLTKGNVDQFRKFADPVGPHKEFVYREMLPMLQSQQKVVQQFVSFIKRASELAKATSTTA